MKYLMALVCLVFGFFCKVDVDYPNEHSQEGR